ncbi:MAG: hypothetical protein M1472_00280 [Planctomycetes bacterium]|nr:hypothetical protein [Planctomycetota bacterium]
MQTSDGRGAFARKMTAPGQKHIQYCINIEQHHGVQKYIVPEARDFSSKKATPLDT